jgi:hypothetical protein
MSRPIRLSTRSGNFDCTDIIAALKIVLPAQLSFDLPVFELLLN